MNTRILDLLGVLSTGRQVSAAELAAQLNTSVRSVRRDIAQLRGQGYRIDAAPGVGGGYVAPEGAVLPPLQFSSEEVFTLALALRTLVGQGLRNAESNAEQSAHVESAVRKLRSVLPPAIASSIDRAADAIIAAPGNEPEVPVDTLAVVASAVAERRLIDLQYRGQDRRVEPYRIVVLGAHWYLLAWALDRAAWRTFRLDRITRTHTTTFGFRSRGAPDAVEFVRSQVTDAVYTFRVRARIQAPAAEVSAAIPARAGTVAATGEDECEIVLGAGSPQWVIVFLLGLQKPFAVVEPADFREEFVRLRNELDHVLGQLLD